MNEVPGLMARMTDVALIAAGAAAALQMRYAREALDRADTAFIAFAAVFALVAFPAFGIYESWRGRSLLRLAGRVSLAWLVVQASGLALMFAMHKTDSLSRLWLAYWTGITGGALVASRLAAYLVLSRARHAGLNLRKVAIVGTGTHVDAVLHRIATSPASGFRVTALLDVGRDRGQLDARAGACAPIAVFAELDAFAAQVRADGVRELWLALALSEEATIRRVVAAFRDDLVNIRFMPDMRNVALFESEVTDLVGVPAISLVASPLPGHAAAKKEAFDRIFAALALVALSPLLIAIAAAVKLSSPGPVLFTQKRQGADGRVFRIYKFRTMRVHAEVAGTVTQATRNDSRITPVGAFLRRTSLDELPQFFNVLRGEMSVVGPRPHALEHDELYRKVVDGYIHRYRIKPGITGWAQINGYRGETDRIEKMQGRVEYDLYYLRNWSFALDIRIVLVTIAKGFVHRNAY